MHSHPQLLESIETFGPFIEEQKLSNISEATGSECATIILMKNQAYIK
jgi:hypothetical protein